MAESHGERQMQTIGALPDGRTLYWAEPGQFSEPGFKVWDPDRGEHVPIVLREECPPDEETAKEALYMIVVRTPIEDGGAQHTRTMEAIEQALGESIPLKGEGTTVGASVSLCSALTANHHGFLREFGFDFDTANQLITVATVGEVGG